jgi:ATP-binding cassette, subfamily B, bacterial
MKIQLVDYYTLLGPYFKEFRALFLLVTFFLLSSVGLQIISPQLMKHFIDQAISHAVLSSIIYTAVLFLIVTIFQQMLTVSATYSGQSLAWHATNKLRKDLMEHCLYLDMSFHNSKLKGEFIERIDGDVLRLAGFFSQLLITVIGNLLLMVCVLIIIILENHLVGMVAALVSILGVFMVSLTKNLAVPHQQKLQQTHAELYGYLEERLSSIEDIKAMGALNFIMNEFYAITRRIRKFLWDTSKRIIVIRSMGYIVSTAIYIVMFPLCFYLYRQNALTVGAVFMIVYYIAILTGPIRNISDQVQSLQGVGASINRTRELLNIKSEIKDGNLAVADNGNFMVSFEGVDFSYIKDKPVLQDINFNLKENSILGVIGRTGSGKTTLSRLLFRLYNVDRGRIMIGDHDIRDYNLKSLRNSVAMVTQDIHLFRATIRENLTFFDTSINDDQIIDALRNLRLFDWFQKLPDGLNTMLNSGDSGLSAGESQLLAFTRVFLKNPRLIILDEASSRLDPATENLLDQAIRNLLTNRTAIIIAHRLQTIEKADSILILEQGKIREFGNRKSLKANPDSHFSNLLKTGIAEVMV